MIAVVDAMANRSRTVNGKPMSLIDIGYLGVGLDDNWQACGTGVNGTFHDQVRASRSSAKSRRPPLIQWEFLSMHLAVRQPTHQLAALPQHERVGCPCSRQWRAGGLVHQQLYVADLPRTCCRRPS